MPLHRFYSSLLGAAALLTGSATAHAGAFFSWGATAENAGTDQSVYLQSLYEIPSFSTEGLQSADTGSVRASVSSWADPVSGVFKAINTATTGGSASDANSIAESYARLDVFDSLRVRGPGSTTTLTITLDYDTLVSGLSFSQTTLSTSSVRFMQVDSTRSVSLSYEEANSLYDPTASCIDYGSDGLFCPIEAQPFVTRSFSDGAELFREWALTESGRLYSNGSLEEGRHTGTVSLRVSVPVDTDISLSYYAYNGARCFHVALCSAVSDASHSDYISVSVDEGYTVVSAEGFRYQGMAAAVPEPASSALMLLGLAGLYGFQRRRRG